MTLQERVRELEQQHGGLRAAARAIQIEPSYLCRLGTGEKAQPSEAILRRLGLRRVVTYKRAPSSRSAQVK